MDSGLYKTITFVCFILIGVFLKSKIKSKDEKSGIKAIILNLALPATIFIALLGVKVQWNLLFLPIMALTLNVILFLATPFVLPLVGIKKGSAEFRTARLLIPSLAPGLSCFPFVLEFLGENALAKVAMADLGNKIFVLVILYVVAMNWHYQLRSISKKGNGKLMSLLKVLISEPVNIFIAAALLLLMFGFTMDSLPILFSDILEKLSIIMTPLVLLFIGLGIKLKRKQFFQVFSVLCIRAGLVFALGGVFVWVSGIQSLESILLLLAFGLSSCSFWPYAHISAVEHLEIADTQKRTFDGDFALNILALSFPLSTVLILGVLNTGTFFATNINILFVGGTLFAVGLIYPLLNGLNKKVSLTKVSKAKIERTTPEHI
ncbi:AEC family transporter [Flagellimonas sp.]|uniref:AEC family transporter n=1 Tax=Flagellimonas sp. TaxID=2058762 RepID=UPI003F4A0947